MRRPLLALALALVISAVQAHDTDKDEHRPGQDISHVNRGITAEAGRQYGDLETVNGGVNVERGASADTVETVNGGIRLDDEAEVGSAETVNGGITAGERVKVARGAETVNGGIRFGFNSRIGGDIETVNGGITVQQTEVLGELRTVSGDITVGAKSRIGGGIVVEKPQGISWGKNRTPRIVIGPNAVVEGELRFERTVELYVHTTAKVGPVSGTTARAYTDALPARND